MRTFADLRAGSTRSLASSRTTGAELLVHEIDYYV